MLDSADFIHSHVKTIAVVNESENCYLWFGGKCSNFKFQQASSIGSCSFWKNEKRINIFAFVVVIDSLLNLLHDILPCILALSQDEQTLNIPGNGANDWSILDRFL